ncbi:MAG: glycosyltransferase family 4 protein [Bacteroidales bacterium]|nr:glycosyltransferase family 4 protein [Bacteroidales bacterium]
MRVLICTPYNSSPEVVQSGIGVWARNIVEYYDSISSTIELTIIPFDRVTRVDSKMSFISRCISGAKEYSHHIKKTSKILKQGGYDVIHLCTSASISLLKDYYLLCKARRLGIKTVVHFHFGRIPDLYNNRNWEWKILVRVISVADRTIVMDIQSYNVLKERYTSVFYLPNPLSLKVKSFINYRKNIINREPNRVLFVGHVIPTKGIFELLEACKGIPGIELHIVGHVTPEILREVKERLVGDQHWLIFHGEIPHERVITEMLLSGIFALPTYTEGFPNVIIEAMACGCSIVTTPVGAIPEMLDIYGDEPCGLVSAPKEVESLRNNIGYLYKNVHAAKVFSERAISRVNRLYSVNVVWDALTNIWES